MQEQDKKTGNLFIELTSVNVHDKNQMWYVI